MSLPARSLALAACLVAGLVAPAAAQSATAWTQFQGGASHPGVAAGPEPGYREAWTLPVPPGGPGDRFGLSAPVFGEGLVIAVGPEQVVAVDVETGERAWALDKVLGPSVPGAVAGDAFVFTEGWGDGPPEDPAVAVSPTPSATTSPSPSGDADEPGEEPTPSALVAVSLEDRSELWRAALPEVSRSGVTVIGDLALVGTNDGSVTAVDLATGDEAWSVDIGPAVDVAIAAEGDLVVASSRGSVDAGPAIVGLSLTDGSERWRFAPSTPALFTGPPTIAHGAAFVGYVDRKVVAIETSDGSERWSATLNAPAPLSPISASEDAVFVIDVNQAFGSQLTAFDPSTGDRLWDHPLGALVARVPPMLLGGYVVTGAIDGDLFAFDASTGDLVWQGRGPGPVRALAADGSTLVAVRAQPAGLTAYEHDAGATLVAIQSPTSPQPGLLVAWWAAGAAIVGAAAFGLGHLLTRRLGPAVLPDDTEDEDG